MQNWLYLRLPSAAKSRHLCAQVLRRLHAPAAVVVVVTGYVVAIYLLSLTLRTIPVGVAYAIWSGVGVALIAVIGWLFLGQRLDAPAIAGLALIVTGVVVINLFSKTAGH